MRIRRSCLATRKDQVPNMGQKQSKVKQNEEIIPTKKIDKVQAPFEEYAKLMVIAFISQIEKSFDREMTIPHEIMILCFKFYQIEHNLYLMDHRHTRRSPFQLYVSVMDGQQNWKINLAPLYTSLAPRDVEPGHTHLIHYKNNAQLPSNIALRVSQKYKQLGFEHKSSTNNYDIIFSTTAYNNCNCIIVDPLQFKTSSTEEIIGIEWKLPTNSLTPNGYNGYYNRSDAPGSSVYSSRYGLIQYNQEGENIASHKGAILGFVTDDKCRWENIKPHLRHIPARNLCISLMETMDNNEKLMIIDDDNIQFYDLSDKEWEIVNFKLDETMKLDIDETSVYKMATCFDKRFQRLYVGDNKVYSYDFEKQFRTLLPAKPIKYTNSRTMTLFKRYDLLFCVNGIMNPIQYLDLRENKGEWKVIEQPFSSLIKRYGASHRMNISDNGDFVRSWRDML